MLALCLGPLLGVVLADLAVRLNPAWWRWLASAPPGEVAQVEGALHGARRGSVSVVILGSSVAMRDVDEDLLEAALPHRQVHALNLGINGASGLATAMMAREVEALGPHAAIYVLGPTTLAQGRMPGRMRVYDPVVAWEMFGLDGMTAAPALHRRGILGAVLLPYRQRVYLHSWWQDWRHRTSQPHPRNGPSLQGPRLKGDLDRAREAHDRSVIDGTGVHAQGLAHLASRLAAAGIHLLVVPAPQHPLLGNGVFPDDQRELLDRLAAAHGFAALDPGSPAAYTQDDFADARHLAPPGQRTFTLTLARHLEALWSD